MDNWFGKERSVASDGVTVSREKFGYILRAAVDLNDRGEVQYGVRTPQSMDLAASLQLELPDDQPSVEVFLYADTRPDVSPLWRRVEELQAEDESS